MVKHPQARAQITIYRFHLSTSVPANYPNPFPIITSAFPCPIRQRVFSITPQLGIGTSYGKMPRHPHFQWMRASGYTLVCIGFCAPLPHSAAPCKAFPHHHTHACARFVKNWCRFVSYACSTFRHAFLLCVTPPHTRKI